MCSTRSLSRLLLGTVLALCPAGLAAQPALPAPALATPSRYGEPPRRIEPPDAPAPVDEQARNTAIALNYCRASFHRIRKYPTKPVLAEEQEKILNNLNLQGIEDPEVIQLYTAVLDEIGQIEFAGRERHLTQTNHVNSLQRKAAWDLLALGTDLATGSYGNAIRQGANSWWDYRNLTHQRDNDLLRIERNRMQSVTQKSSTFLDTFWKLARRKNIPDRWLVRGDDLDALEAAQLEPDAEKRLRILRRMEPYMQAYPPYWYYVARTEQELGQLVAAAETYTSVARIGAGHFRKDDMLATSLANLATIQWHLGSAEAVRTAERALEFSTDVWEANLLCARILERGGRIAAAEDAILRNLDVRLESERSLVFLASLYDHANECSKLAKLLERPETVAALPAPVLLRCAARLGAAQTPPHVLQAVTASLEVQPRQWFGGDELIVRMSPAWQLHLARVEVSVRGQKLPAVPAERIAEGFQFRYPGRVESGGGRSVTSPAGVAIALTYPDDTVVQVAFEGGSGDEASRSGNGLLTVRTGLTRPAGGGLRISGISVNNAQIALTQSSALRSIPAGADAPTRGLD